MARLDLLDQAHERVTEEMRKAEDAMLKARQREMEVASIDGDARTELTKRFPGADRK